MTQKDINWKCNCDRISFGLSKRLKDEITGYVHDNDLFLSASEFIRAAVHDFVMTEINKLYQIYALFKSK